jgi:hypothetical protein
MAYPLFGMEGNDVRLERTDSPNVDSHDLGRRSATSLAGHASTSPEGSSFHPGHRQKKARL